MGYYRVNYDENNWNLLIQQLQTDHEVIHLINRAQLLDDALDLAGAGFLSYTTAFSINAYLSSETEYVPWTAALDNMGYIEQMFTRTGHYGSLRNYLLDLLVPLYNSVGFEDNLNDPHLDQLTRVTAVTWACKLDYSDCVSKSVALYTSWMANPSNQSIISPNEKKPVICTAIADGGEEEWNFAWNQYLTSNIATEKDALMLSMACSKEVWILSRYLDIVFMEDSRIRKQDAARVFSAIARNDVGRDLAWDYLKNQWDILYTFFKSFTTLGDLLTVVTEEFNTVEQKKEVIIFRDEHQDDLAQADRAVEQAVERISNNIDWMAKNYDVIVQWLADNGYP
ncbi:hypothetical protein SK128_001738 [Halocaridina rubra]|uniref:ERAP1-like C-terminal domain-containing protein n=1 Tax=Halocaridina rubra TaxID=373956 RepID=A0AAN8XNQ7_HALRR